MAKRLGLLTVLAVVFVFGVEAVLAGMRQRNVDVAVFITDQAGNQIDAPQSAKPTPAPGGTPVAVVSNLILNPNNGLWVRVSWSYKIGPRFPETVIGATVYDKAGQIISTANYKIDCAGSALDCTGDTRLALNYGVKAEDPANQTKAPWVAGDYNVQITRTFIGLKPVIIKEQALLVSSASQ